MKQALIITGKFVQDSEYIYPYHRFREAGYEVKTATEDGKETFGVWGTKVLVDMATADMRVDDFEVLILPGGARAMEYIRQDQKVLDFIHAWDAKKKVIACICHGSQLLISARVVSGRRISGYYSIKDDITNAGATYSPDAVVVDGNIITSPHYKYMGEWMREVFNILNTP